MVAGQYHIYVRLADTTVATAQVVALADKKFKRPFGAAIPAAPLSAPRQPARAARSTAARGAVLQALSGSFTSSHTRHS